MNPSPDDPHQKLERLVHRTLRELPARRAPRSLEGRVFAELARRAALPWWRKSFVHWPVPARAALLVVLLGVVKLVLMGGVWAASGFDAAQFREAFAQQLSWMESGIAVVNASRSFFEIMFRNIPPLWLYGGVAFIAALYAALFGLGAAAYKALHVQR
jgi:hypothetical protein